MVKHFAKRRFCQEPTRVGNDIFMLLEKMGGNHGRYRLARLWANWREVLGAALADQILACGHKGALLVLVVAGPPQMQELSFQSAEILEKVNKFLEQEYFTGIRFRQSLRK